MTTSLAVFVGRKEHESRTQTTKSVQTLNGKLLSGLSSSRRAQATMGGRYDGVAMVFIGATTRSAHRCGSDLVVVDPALENFQDAVLHERGHFLGQRR